MNILELSIRVRMARSLKAFNLSGNMDRAERTRFEQAMTQAWQVMIDNPDLRGPHL